ncbi:MAG: hypothetical protein U9R05_04075 [Chloroflexota bacterium]|nr:hypothetical protein [Chloroflexota bacterium]
MQRGLGDGLQFLRHGERGREVDDAEETRQSLLNTLRRRLVRRLDSHVAPVQLYLDLPQISQGDSYVVGQAFLKLGTVPPLQTQFTVVYDVNLHRFTIS